MPSIDSFDASVTRIEYAWPEGVSGIERIMLSATGDLQRLLCAFFDRPITISCVHAETSPYTLTPVTPIASSSKSTRADIPPFLSRTSIPPITQSRQVHLLCSGRVVCEATSTVTISSRECAALFLEEGYAIGQLFRKLGTVPRFELVDVGIEREDAEEGKDEVKSKSFRPEKLWRRYTLKIEGFECDILEVFPDRRIFTMGIAWLDSKHTRVKPIPPRLIIKDEKGNVKDTDSLSSSTPLSSCGIKTPTILSASIMDDSFWRDNFGGRTRLLIAFLAVLYLLIRGEANLRPTGWSSAVEAFGEGST